jgi:hypothetical protein
MCLFCCVFRSNSTLSQTQQSTQQKYKVWIHDGRYDGRSMMQLHVGEYQDSTTKDIDGKRAR